MSQPESIADRILARVVDMESFEANDVIDLTTAPDRLNQRKSLHCAIRRLVREGHLEVLVAPSKGRAAHKAPGRWRYRS